MSAIDRAVENYEEQPAKPVTADEVRMLLQEADKVGEEAKEAFLGIDNVWQAAVFIVLGYVILDRVFNHYFGNKKIKAIEKNINGYGKDKNGNTITLADIQKQEIRLMKECRWYLQQIARRMGVKKDDI